METRSIRNVYQKIIGVTPNSFENVRECKLYLASAVSQFVSSILDNKENHPKIIGHDKKEHINSENS